MVLGFFRHILAYFEDVPAPTASRPEDLRVHPTSQVESMFPQFRLHGTSGLQGVYPTSFAHPLQPHVPFTSPLTTSTTQTPKVIPFFNQSGMIMGYMEVPNESLLPAAVRNMKDEELEGKIRDASVVVKETRDIGVLTMEAEQLDTRKPIPLPQHPVLSKKNKKSKDIRNPTHRARKLPSVSAGSSSSGAESSDSPEEVIEDPGEWDGWPDGFFQRDYALTIWDETKKLAVNWAHGTGGGDRRGDESARFIQQGKKSRRACLGIIECDNRGCTIITRPQTKPYLRAGQLAKRCECGAVLLHRECDAYDIIYKWNKGFHYEHYGHHLHHRPLPVHLSFAQEKRFSEMVKAHPKTGPLGLLAGVPGPDGKAQSAADISDTLLNPHRISKEKAKVKQGIDSGIGGDSFIRMFADFDRAHGDFIRSKEFGDITIISCQTPWMASQFIKDYIPDEPINGSVNDAAHGWWAQSSSLLMTTSIYSPVLKCWAPGMFSYSNGATAEHWKCHFRAVMDGIAEEAKACGLGVVDGLFAGVMDLSDAEREGFTLAFADFWMSREENTRDLHQLLDDAKNCLKGCQEHYRRGIAKMSRSSGLIPSELGSAFRHRAMGLLAAGSSGDFEDRVMALMRDFPNVAPWLGWWMREPHARMIFPTQRGMTGDVWDSMPNTTNAQESLHFKFYSAQGKKHTLLDGLEKLYAIALMMERQSEGVLKGARIRYGKAEPWKQVKAKIGRTKPSRAPEGQKKQRYINDGKPPFTTKQLLGKASNPDNNMKPAKKRMTKGDADSRKPKGKEMKAEGKKAEGKETKGEGEETKGEGEKTKGEGEETKGSLMDKKARLHNILTNIPVRLRRLGDMDAKPLISTTNSPPIRFNEASYRWKNNSCYLDTALHLFRLTAQRDTEGFRRCMDCLPTTGKGLRQVVQHFDKWEALIHTKGRGTDDKGKVLSKQRDDLRKMLHVLKVIKSLTTPESLFVWLWELVNKAAETPKGHRAAAYFETLFTELHECTGSPESTGRHIEVVNQPTRKRFHQLGLIDWARYQGDVSQWFANLTRSKPERVINERGCWRVFEGETLCSGKRHDYQGVLLSLPVMLVIEIGETPHGNGWSFPAALASDAHPGKATYDLVGLALVHGAATPEGIPHFTARYCSSDHSTMYSYNGMLNNGRVTIEDGASMDTHLCGSSIKLSKNVRVWAAVYHLNGGAATQDQFYLDRRAELEMTLDIEVESSSLAVLPSIRFTGRGLRQMDPADRIWLLRTTGRTQEYITTSNDDVSMHGDSAASSLSPESEDGVETGSDDEQVDQLDPSDADSASEFELDCRCGRQGNGNTMYQSAEEGLAVQCNQCTKWSHVACQRHGWASNLPKSRPFECDGCSMEAILPWMKSTDRSNRRTDTISKRPLDERLKAGTGALSRHGQFWYPVRLIQRQSDGLWRVRWWRHCQFTESGTTPDSITTVNEADIIDCLWHNQAGRRKIRLGKWTQAHDVQTDEDILADPTLVPYSREIDEALADFIPILIQLMNAPRKLASDENVPAKKWLESQKLSLTAMIPLVGDLTITERAQTCNWFESAIPKASTLRHKWIGSLPLAHAFTLLIAARLSREEPVSVDAKDITRREYVSQFIDKAWEIQVAARTSLDPIDVDKECLSYLENSMFENSVRAGLSGYYQWGLDAGDHQERWDPYTGNSEVWNVGDREGNEDDLQRGPDFISIAKGEDEVVTPAIRPNKRGPETVPQEMPRPRPRPRKRRKL